MVFANLTVMENLRMGAYLRRDKANFGKDFDYIFSIFPRLKEREQQTAGTLSGGEQQMLAIGRALMSKPSRVNCRRVMEALLTIRRSLSAMIRNV